MNPRPNPKVERALVTLWNQDHPVGTSVKVRRDDGTETHTSTTSEAWMLGEHSAVIKLAGISGCYSLNRCIAV
jgi:hypothetical protein